MSAGRGDAWAGRWEALRTRVGAVTGVGRLRGLEDRFERLGTAVAEEEVYLRRLERQVADLERDLSRVWPTP